MVYEWNSKTTNGEGLTIYVIFFMLITNLMAWSKPLFYIDNRKTHETSSTFKDAFLPKQVTGGHNIFAYGWAGASNLHPHPYLNPQTQTYRNKYQERSFSHLLIIRSFDL